MIVMFKPNIILSAHWRTQATVTDTDSLLLLPSCRTETSYSIFCSLSLTSLQTSCRCSWGKPNLCTAGLSLCWKLLGLVSQPQGSRRSYSYRQKTWHWHWLLLASLCQNNGVIPDNSFILRAHLMWIQSTPLNHLSFLTSSTPETLCLTSWQRARIVSLAPSDIGTSGGKTRQSFQSRILR